MTKIILVANTEWYLYNFRLSLASYLRQQGYEVALISPPGRFTARLEQAGFRWIAWGLGRKTLAPWKELASLLALAQLYRRERPHLVHHHTIKPVLYGSLAARLAGIPAVVNSITGRGYLFMRDTRTAHFLRWLLRPWYHAAFSPANCAVIFENVDDRRYFLDARLVYPERTWLIEGVGVDPEIFSPLPEPEGTPVILLAARLLWDKGIGTLVEAARRLKPRTSARLVLVGEPDPGNPASIETATLQAWVDEGLVEWWGWQEDMPSVYARCHIVVLPSLGEGAPTALLEAAACGRPLVTTDVPGCRDVVEDGVNGFIVPPNDPAALAAALEKLVLSPALRGRMGAAGRQRVLAHFTTSHVNARTLNVYQQIWKSAQKP